MSEVLEVMMQLQDKDLELRRLLLTRTSIPREIELGVRELEEEKKKVEAKEEELLDLQKSRRALERDLDEMAERIKEQEAQLPKVSNNKEYQAYLGEISAAKGRVSEAESRLLEMMEKEETLAGEVDAVHKSLEPRVAEIERTRRELESQLGRNEEMIPVLEKDRADIAGRLSPDVRNRYERIAKGKEGLAVVSIIKGACGGCFTAQPPQRINEVKRNDRLITCEHCGRVLVWNNGPQGEGGAH
jgi:predicted  nucleic acid-binding Zn-ribbon protein